MCDWRPADRIRLLVHILCELRESHGITADKLKDAGQDVRRQIMPAERIQVLDEIYYVRDMEELYLDGKISMCRNDHLEKPGALLLTAKQVPILWSTFLMSTWAKLAPRNPRMEPRPTFRVCPFPSLQ